MAAGDTGQAKNTPKSIIFAWQVTFCLAFPRGPRTKNVKTYVRKLTKEEIMKVNSLIAKTALAAAIAGASFAASAGTLTIPTPSIFANEIFGTGSETTSIRLPQTRFKADTAKTAAAPWGGVGTAVATGATVKLTLEGNAVFAENYQDPAAWAGQGVSLTVNNGTASAAFTPADQVVMGGTGAAGGEIVDITGGTAGDNQITITFAAAAVGNLKATDTLDWITIEGLKVQNLKSALERVGTGSQRTSGVTLEVRDAVGNFENTNKPAAFVSINGVDMTHTATDYATLAGGRSRIQVAEDQKLFTGVTGSGAATDFTTSTNVLDLGTLTLARGVTPGEGGVAAGLDAGKETGVAFDFTGQDVLTLNLDTDADLANYGNVYLTPTGGCTGYAAATDFLRAANNTFPVTTADINLGAATTLNLCAEVPAAGAAGKIPQADFGASMKVTYFNVRYTESTGEADYGRVLRNGCSVTLFNLPNVNAADKAMIRFTNTSANQSGEVTVTVWGEDGTKLDESQSVLSNLPAHATTVLHTNASLADNASRVYLGDVLPKFAASEGRSRVIVEGAFPSCEALGQVRSNNGTLVNMTSTVYSGTSNGTSNTDN